MIARAVRIPALPSNRPRRTGGTSRRAASSTAGQNAIDHIAGFAFAYPEGSERRPSWKYWVQREASSILNSSTSPTAVTPSANAPARKAAALPRTGQSANRANTSA